MVQPCSEQDPETDAGPEVDDDWDEPTEEVNNDGRLQPGSLPDRAEG